MTTTHCSIRGALPVLQAVATKTWKAPKTLGFSAAFGVFSRHTYIYFRRGRATELPNSLFPRCIQPWLRYRFVTVRTHAHDQRSFPALPCSN